MSLRGLLLPALLLAYPLPAAAQNLSDMFNELRVGGSAHVFTTRTLTSSDEVISSTRANAFSLSADFRVQNRIHRYAHLGLIFSLGQARLKSPRIELADRVWTPENADALVVGLALALGSTLKIGPVDLLVEGVGGFRALQWKSPACAACMSPEERAGAASAILEGRVGVELRPSRQASGRVWVGIDTLELGAFSVGLSVGFHR